jgi:hypothetical protein
MVCLRNICINTLHKGDNDNNNNNNNNNKLIDQSPLSHRPAKNFLTVRHPFSIAAFHIKIYRPGRRMSTSKESNAFFGVGGALLTVGNTNGAT